MRWHRFWPCLGAQVQSVSVRVKIMGIALTLTLLLGLVITLQVRRALSVTLVQELQRRALAIAQSAASEGADFLLTDNLVALHQVARTLQEAHPDVRYIFFLDSQGYVWGNTFGAFFPPDLLAVNVLPPGAHLQTEILDTEEGFIHDVAVLVLEGQAGVVRVGLSERRVRQQIARTTTSMLLVTGLVALLGMGVAYLLTGVLMRPIIELVEVTRAVGTGDFQRQARVWAHDEIGRLSVAFNAMIERLEESHQELARKERMRIQLLDKVITAQEEERKRVARELHDQTSQALTSLMIGLKVASGVATLEEVKTHLAELRGVTAQILEEVHDLALALRPSVLDHHGLVVALQRYVQDCAEKFGLKVDYQTVGMEGQRLLPQIEIALYRIVQEALLNVIRHAEAQSVCVALEHQGSSVLATVEDDGRGFYVAAAIDSERRERSLGLFGMQERAALIGGKLTIVSAPGQGTTVVIEAPVEPRKG